MPMRIAVITPDPTPYRDPFWNAVAARPEIDLHVFYCGGGTQDRPWEVSWQFDFQAEVMPGRNLHANRGYDACCYYNPGLPRRLKQGRYDGLIFGGYNHRTMQIGLVHALRHRIPYFMMSEVYLKQPRRLWRKVIKSMPLRFLLKNAAGCFPTGTLAQQYLQHYGASPERMCHVPNAPDVELYWQRAQQLAPERATLRQDAGFGDEPIILFVGRLLPLKEVDTLLKSFAQVVQRQRCRLVILGSGPTQPELERLSRELGVSDLVSFPGFLPPDELPSWYAMSDLFVLPSSDETWSVVVLEALASGVPVVITNMVGCYADVLNDPLVGEAVEPRDVSSLTDAITRRLAAPVSREEVAARWLPVREKLRYGRIAERMVRCLGDWGVTSSQAAAKDVSSASSALVS